MPDYFFDTSVLVAYFANEDTRSIGLLEDVVDGKATAAVSTISVAELWSLPDMDDADKQRRRQAVIQLMEMVPIDREVAIRGGALRRSYGLRLPDALIAACAQVAGGRFFSKDIHFRRMLAADEIAGEVY